MSKNTPPVARDAVWHRARASRKVKRSMPCKDLCTKRNQAKGCRKISGAKDLLVCGITPGVHVNRNLYLDIILNWFIRAWLSWIFALSSVQGKHPFTSLSNRTWLFSPSFLHKDSGIYNVLMMLVIRIRTTLWFVKGVSGLRAGRFVEIGKSVKLLALEQHPHP